MPKKLVLRSLKNEIYKFLKQKGLNPNEFEWSEKNSECEPDLIISALIHKPSKYYFTFDYDVDRMYSEVSPWMTSTYYNSHFNDFGGQVDVFMQWLDILKAEIETPDLWEKIISDSTNSDYTTITDNSIFSPADQNLIKQKLDKLSSFIQASSTLNDNQQKY